jgi:hypothetical protein
VTINGEPTRIIVRTQGSTEPHFGESVRVALNSPARVHVFDPDTGERLPD